MSLDDAFSRAKVLCEELEPRLSEIETEQDARLQIINRFLTEVLGWSFADLKTEPHGPSGYTDYLLSAFGQKRFVIEAKRIGPLIINTLNPETRTYKVGGPALVSASPGIKQAASYCMDHGVNYAAITTGVVWIAFIPLPGSGVSYKDGIAFAFPTFKTILENFAIFYDLFSKEGVSKKTYNLHFAKAGGLSITAFEPLIASNQNEYIRLVPQSQIAADLDPIFREFFGSLSMESDRQMMIECFVETRESKYADASLEKMVRSVSATISTLEARPDNQLAQEIEHAVESGRGETVILVGNNGAGKSTFLECFFEAVLEPALRSRCMIARIDLLQATGDLNSIVPWLTRELKNLLEGLLFPGGQPSYEELQGLYWREYQRWMKGQYKPLYEADKTAFKIKFSDFLNEQMESDPYSYILRLLEDVVRNRKLLPCIIFDNTDHFVDPNYQETIFQFSQALHKTISFTLIVMPITDRSLWRLSKAGPLQTYSSKMFYLPVPPTKEVLEKRVAYLKRIIEEDKDKHSYFFAKGIRLTVENIRGFAACLEELFLKADFVARRISWLANNNLRKCLELTQKIIVSPIFSIEDLVKAFIVHGSTEALRVDSRKFMQALLHGNYNAFQQDHNTFIFNVFAISPYFPTTPFLSLGILKLLIDRTGDDAGVSGYISLEQVSQYFVALGISEPALNHALSLLLSYRLIEPYDASDETLASTQRVAITHSGRMHYELAVTDSFFVGDMAFATPVRSFTLVETLRSIRSKHMGGNEWEAVQRLFFEYCFDQDGLYVKIPRDDIYEGQRLLRSDLMGRWVENRKTAADVKAPEAKPGVSQASAIIKWYSPAKGFGFVEAGLGEDVFFHRNQLQQAKIETVGQGDTLICDIAPGPKGRLQVITVYSVQACQPANASSDALETRVEGVVEFYNVKRGYGFIKAPTLGEDIYVSSKVLEQNGLELLLAGAKVKAGITQRGIGKGKGYIASSIEIIS